MSNTSIKSLYKMLEDIAKTVHLALQIGTPDIIPDEEVARAHRRYTEKYGQ